MSDSEEGSDSENRRSNQPVRRKLSRGPGSRVRQRAQREDKRCSRKKQQQPANTLAQHDEPATQTSATQMSDTKAQTQFACPEAQEELLNEELLLW